MSNTKINNSITVNYNQHPSEGCFADPTDLVTDEKHLIFDAKTFTHRRVASPTQEPNICTLDSIYFVKETNTITINTTTLTNPSSEIMIYNNDSWMNKINKYMTKLNNNIFGNTKTGWYYGATIGFMLGLLRKPSGYEYIYGAVTNGLMHSFLFQFQCMNWVFLPCSIGFITLSNYLHNDLKK